MAQSQKSQVGVARACPAGIPNFGKSVCQGIPWQEFFLGHCHTRWVLTPFPGCPQRLVASHAAPASHLSLHKSRKCSRAPVPALSRIPNGTGIFGDGLCLPVWNVVPYEPLSFGSACHLCPILCWGSSEQDPSGFIFCWILIASLEPKPLVFLGEPALPGSSEALPASGRAWSTWICNWGGKTAQHPASPCSSQECCPLNPCSELPQHEDSKETQALLMCPSFSM